MGALCARLPSMPLCWLVRALALAIKVCASTELPKAPPPAGCFFGKDGHAWARDYLYCCHGGVASTEAAEMCAHCCCSDIDYGFLRKQLVTFAPALLYTSSLRLGNQIPEAYVAGSHLVLHCFGSVQEWLASADPVGVIALRFFWLVSEIDVVVQEGGSAVNLHIAPSLVQQLHGLFRVYPSWAIYESGWPIFLLAWAAGRLLQKAQLAFHQRLEQLPITLQELLRGPNEGVAKRHLLESSVGTDGEIGKLIWQYAGVSGPASYAEVAGDIGPQLMKVTPTDVSDFIRPALLLAQADYLRHLEPRSCASGLRDNVALEATTQALQLFMKGEPHQMLFHELPLLQLLDRLSMPRAMTVEHDICLFLPTVRASALECDSMRASYVVAHGSAGCRPELFHLLEAMRPNISHLIDVGAQFGACAVVAARQFSWLRVTALELEVHNTDLIEKSAAANGLLGRLRAHAVKLVPHMTNCISTHSCNTLDTAYPFVQDGIKSGQIDGLCLWLSQLGESLQPILQGASNIIRLQLVDVIAIVAAPTQLEAAKHFFGDSYAVDVWYGGRTEFGQVRYDILVAKANRNK